jgi:HK97 family phage portal protein
MGLKSWFTGLFASDGDRSPWGDFWFEPVTTRTISGGRVSADTAMRLSAVFASVRLISSQFAMLPFKLYKTIPNGGKQIITDHWLYNLLARRPNQWQNAFEWREMLQGHLELRGNAYNRIYSNSRGEITDLVPIHPDTIKIEMLSGGNYRYRVSNSDGSETVLARGDVWHLRTLSSNGLMGISTVEYARESLGMGLSAQEYAARFFANDQKPTGGWINFPGKFANDEARKVFGESIKKAVTGARRHGMLVLDQGMEYHEVGVTNKDAQFLEMRQFSVTDIARWFGVPPHKIGDLSRATFSNIEQQDMQFVRDCLAPRAERWEASIEADLLLDHDIGLEVEFDFANLLRGDSLARAAFYASGIQNGWMTRNEARLAENLNPLDGLDEPLRPLNMVEENTAENLIDDPEPKTEPDENPEEPDGDEASARLRAVLQGNAERMARRLVKSGPPADIALIAEAMGVSVEQVDAWARLSEWNAETFTVENVAASILTIGNTP